MTDDLASRLRASATQARAIDRAKLLEEAAETVERLMLTDAERAAVAWAATHLENCGWGSAALRSLLERMPK